MKINIAAGLITILAGMTVSTGVFALPSPMVVDAGMMQFVGSLTDGPCAVQASGKDRLVTLSQVKASKLLEPGQPAGQVRLFHVVLNDCNISVYSNAQVSFAGQTDNTFKTVLVNQSTEGAASHVGLQLYGPNGDKIVPDDSSSIPLTNGFNVIPLTVDYVPVGLHPTAGSVTSTVTFRIIYS